MTELPDGWTWVRLRDLGTWYGGGTPSKHVSEYWVSGTVPWLSPKDMGADRLAGTQDHIAQSAIGATAVKLIPPGSVAVVVRSGILERLIPIALVPFATTLNQDMKAVVANDSIDPRWIAWGLRAYETQLLRDTRKAGTTVASLEIPRFLNFEIPVAPLDEQRRIVANLEDHLAHLDAAGSRLSRASDQMDTLVTNILLDLIPDASDYPSDWTPATVGQAGNLELGRQRHPDWHTGPNTHPYLRVANVFEDRFDLSDIMQMHWPEQTFERFRLKSGDILLNEGQSPQFLGRPAIYRGDPPDIAFTNSLLRFQANANVLPEFALLVFRRHMRAGRFIGESRITTNIAHLSAGRLKTVEFPIPPLAKQRSLVQRADDLLAAAGQLSAQLTAIGKGQIALRRSLLSAAFSGYLAPNHREKA